MKPSRTWLVYSGPIGIIVLWACTITAMHRGGLGLIDSRPLSYLGVNGSTARIFSLGLLVSSGLFITFAFYVRRIYAVGNQFLTYFLVGQAGQIVAAISSYGKPGTYKTIHTIAAFTLAFSLPLLIRVFYISLAKKRHHNVYKRLYYFELMTFAIGMGIFTMTRGIAPTGEILSAIGFHVWIVVVSYLTIKAA